MEPAPPIVLLISRGMRIGPALTEGRWRSAARRPVPLSELASLLRADPGPALVFNLITLPVLDLRNVNTQLERRPTQHALTLGAGRTKAESRRSSPKLPEEVRRRPSRPNAQGLGGRATEGGPWTPTAPALASVGQAALAKGCALTRHHEADEARLAHLIHRVAQEAQAVVVDTAGFGVHAIAAMIAPMPRLPWLRR